ncbi:hypothetical protein [Streptomyces sp. NPDC021020]|uniref:hypothetical protein n=1 Tax=Streptomyces sp. NPDC021020 TaxID=3365109 RepID=UPI0037A720EA
MDEQTGAGRGVAKEPARGLRRLLLAAWRRPETPLEPVPAAEARRRAAHGIRVVGGIWAVVALVVAGLVRVQVIGPPVIGLSALAAMFAGQLAFEIYAGDAEQVTVHVRDGQTLISAKTLTGVRTLDLGALARIRRSETHMRGGYADRLRLLDLHGVRLSLTGGYEVLAALRRAVEADPGVEVTPHAEEALSFARRSRLRALRRSFAGMWLVMASLLVPLLAGFALTAVLAWTNPL